jgi:Fe2+ transport system protein FeoA
MKLKMISNFTDASCAALSELQEGATGILSELDLTSRISEHLMNLGFIPGVEITVARSGPGGDPRIYCVDGAEVALRAELACRIGVRPVPRIAEA